MKKVLSFLLALTLVFALSACDEDTGSNLENSAKPENSAVPTPSASAADESTGTTPSPTLQATATPTSVPDGTGNTNSTPTAKPTATPTAKPTVKPTATPLPTLYAEDLTMFTSTATYESLKQDLQKLVTTTEFTYGTPPYFTYSLIHELKKVSVLGYYAEPQYAYEHFIAEAESLWLTEGESFEDDNNEKLTRLIVDFNVPYKTKAFIQQAVTRDIARANAFFGENPIFLMIGGKGYSSFDKIPAEELEKLYTCASESQMLTVSYSKGSVQLGTTSFDGKKTFRASIQADFK